MKKMKLIRWLSAVLIFCMLAAIPVVSQAAASPSPSAAAPSATPEPITPNPEALPEAVMQLYDFRGKYSLTDADGIKIAKTEAQEYESGTTIQTEPASYLWVIIGDGFWLKMDENTNITLNRTISDVEVLLNEGRIFFCYSDLDKEENLIRLRTPIASVEGEKATGMLETKLVTELDPDSKGGMGRVENNCTLTVLTGSADLTFWKTEALTPGSLDKVKHQTMKITAGEAAELQDVTMLDEPNEEDGGRPVRREQSSKISEIDTMEFLEKHPFVGEEYFDRSALARILSSEGTGITSTKIKQYGKDMDDRLKKAESDSAKALEAERKALKKEQETYKAMVEAASVYWYEVVYVFPLQRDEILNPTPAPAATPAPTPTPIPGTFTVTFMANGDTFGMQQVLENYMAGVPGLKPSTKGEWRLKDAEEPFDFYNEKITEDITLYWYSDK